LSPSESDRRRAPRFAVRTNALIAVRGQPLREGVILDINGFGCQLRTTGFEPPAEYHLVDPEQAVAYHCRVMWRQPPLCGNRFISTWSLTAAACPAWLREAVSGARARGLAKGIRLAFGG
jgi:hypothetical protein